MRIEMILGEMAKITELHTPQRNPFEWNDKSDLVKCEYCVPIRDQQLLSAEYVE